MHARVEYKASVLDDLRDLDPAVAQQILDEQERVLSRDPNRGDPLEGEFHGLPKYSSREYRFIYTRVQGVVLVLRIGLRNAPER